MAVYTDVPDDALEAFVNAYDIGGILSCKGIAEGIENSNYLLQTEQGVFILTLYERRVRPEDLPFFLGLMDHLAARGIACPTPVPGRDGNALRELCGRPAAIVTFLNGMCVRRIAPGHCAALGRAVAEMHRAERFFPAARERARPGRLGTAVRDLPGFGGRDRSRPRPGDRRRAALPRCALARPAPRAA